MKDTIQKELAQIEQTQNVRILLAVESGSRALPLRTATMMYGSSTSARKMRICGFKNTVM